jgi:hypothetical protein
MQILAARTEHYATKYTFRYSPDTLLFTLTRFEPFKGETVIEMDTLEWRVFADFIAKVDNNKK